jgi:transcription termination factor Rho
MAEEQLERSILEAKERDELHAIASAMSLKATTRSKKSDIIDLILEATGVDAHATEPAATNGDADAHAGGPSNGVASDVADAPSRSAGPRTRAPRTERATNGAAHHESEGDADADARPAPRFVFDGGDGVASVSATNGDANGVHHGGGSTVEGEESSPSGSDERDSSPVTSNGATEGGATGGAAAANGTGTHAPRTSGGQSRQQGNAQGSQPGNQQGNQPGNQLGDPANRRGRRRRGRDRERSDLPSDNVAFQGELVPVKGLVDLREEGYGFLRTAGYLASQHDVYISVSQARRFSLRKGDAIEGACRPAGPSEKYPALVRIDTVSGLGPEEAKARPRFEDLTPLFPDEPLALETTDPSNITARIIDLISPIGKGQRGLIVSPPKAGKTTVLKQIAHSIEANNPEVHLIVLLVDERPEEVTDMRRSVKGEVVASTFDRPADEHTSVAELTIERAKRLVELGRDVVIVLDGITRLARAYNLAQPATGRVMSGGVDSGALYPPKRFFGAARNIEEGGSLTILATALVDTGSRMDEVIFEEFKGTGNLELRLDRKLAERRLYPAIDVNGSSTRHEELLFGRSELQQVWKLRRVLNALSNEGNTAAGLELLMDKVRSTKSNSEFLADIAKAPVPTA